MRAASWVSPRLVSAYAAHRFARTAARSDTPEPSVDALVARRFVAGPRGGIAAWSWGEGPTVLLVHGWNGSGAQLAGFIAPLVTRGFRVVTFDQPGHGRSHGTSATLVEMADAVRAVARACGDVHAVVAHSLGAAASAVALQRGLEASRVVLLAPPADVRHFASAFAAYLGLTAPVKDAFFRRLQRRLGADLASFDIRTFAPTMRVPLLVMHDVKDREVPFEHGRAIAEAWPGARLVPLERAGHTRMLADGVVIDRAVRFVTERTTEMTHAPLGALEGSLG